MTGVGMYMGNITVQMFYVWGVAIALLGGALAYGIMKTSRLSRREKKQLEQNARLAQQRDDPQKAPESLRGGE